MAHKTAEDFVKEHEDSFAYLKEVSDPEVYQFYLAVIATVCKEYAAQVTANLYTDKQVIEAMVQFHNDKIVGINKPFNHYLKR